MMAGPEALMTITLPPRPAGLTLAWPSQGHPITHLTFAEANDWRRFVATLSIDEDIPKPVVDKWHRTQILLLLAWVEPSLIKAAELAALIALELSVTDRYKHQLTQGPRTFKPLLRHMVNADGLSDEALPFVARHGGTVIGMVDGSRRPHLADLRNEAAHGDPFEGPPLPGLIELVQDLIDFAYRHYRAEADAYRMTSGGRLP